MSAVAILSISALAGCLGGDPLDPNPDPAHGATSFVSADSQAGARSQDNSYGGEGPTADLEDGDKSDGSETRTVEEGDIYRVLGGNLILNLNSYRGVQVIDFSDVHAPRVIGRLRISGYPVEMYVVGTRAFVLLNNYTGYYGNREDVNVEQYQGGLVLSVDITDPTAPVALGHARVPGWIQTSRLTRGNGHEALFVAASNWQGETRTVVRSFSVGASGQIVERTTIDLGGYVQDIQATPQALLVARYDWNQSDYRSRLSLIDISDPDGNMIEGAEVATAGLVRNKTNMDLYGHVLRVASGNWWSGSNTNHLETFDVSDLQHPVPVDHDVFGEGEDLYATLFLGNKAFFVTYRRVDPFHAFEIDDQGNATERAEFVISGWNDYFKPVFNDSHLIGIGKDDAAGGTMAVSLYDIADLSNPAPFLARALVEAAYSWSEASWDDRAFSVLENAVSVPAADGTLETGMVLLPFTGYDGNWQRYVAGVQIFTFSDHTLTQRGLMEHGTWVRRSFLADDTTTANLSEAALSLFDHTNPDDPVELGRVDLAPNYTNFFVFGDYGARLKYDSDYYWWWGTSATPPDNQLQIISLAADPDLAEPVATISVPANAQVFQVNDLAVTAEMRWVQINPDTGEGFYETVLQVWDLADPTQPRQAGRLTTDRIAPYYYWYGYGWGMEDCWNCGGYYYYGGTNTYAVGDSLVFPSLTWEQELLGNEHTCYTYPVHDYNEDCFADEAGHYECSYYTGSISCSSLNGAPPVCTGEFLLCTYDDLGNYDCLEVDPSTITTETYCYDYDRYRYWSHYDLDVIDLRDADDPRLSAELTMPTEEEAVSLLAKDSDLFLTYKLPVEVRGDSRDYVRYFFRKISLADPAHPAVTSGINIPGQLMAVDGATLFTQDFVWGQEIVESALNRLHLEDGLAVLDARRRFVERQVQTIALDGAGHVLAAHQPPYYMVYRDPTFDWEDMVTTLSILDTQGDDFPTLGEVEVDQWAYLNSARDGRALFTVPGGLLVINVANPAQPFAQAYFPVLGWPMNIVRHGDEITFAAGPYGMFRFALDTFNLLPPSS